MVTPFAPSLEWARVYVKVLREGHEKACREASRAAGLSGKDYARAYIPGRMLTIPVEGGAHALKSRRADPVVSEHGKWRREHAGALLAIYGRTPYYQHLAPELEAVYRASEGMRLEDFNRETLALLLSWLDPSVMSGDLWIANAPASAGMPAIPASARAVRAEFACAADPALSILDPLFRHGPDASFLF